MRNSNVKSVALGGMLAAVALVIMCLGGIIPVATYVCPMLCCLLLQIVLRICGRRLAWTWYAAVAVLCMLMAPDKEAAAVFLVLGYYPIVKPLLDRSPVKWILKIVLFNGSIALLYLAILRLLGISLLQEELSIAGLLLMLFLGNITFFMLDRLLTMIRG